MTGITPKLSTAQKNKDKGEKAPARTSSLQENDQLVSNGNLSEVPRVGGDYYTIPNSCNQTNLSANMSIANISKDVSKDLYSQRTKQMDTMSQINGPVPLLNVASASSHHHHAMLSIESMQSKNYPTIEQTVETEVGDYR